MDLSKYTPQWIPISQINAENKMFQFRKDITPESVAALAKSLAEKGQRFPIVVWLRLSGERVVIAGLRRLAAAILNKWESIYAIVIPESEVSYEEALSLNFIENIERKTLNNLDIMFACKKLKDKGETNENIGKYIGKTEGQVRRYLKVVDAPADIQQKLQSGDVTIKQAASEKIVPEYDSSGNTRKYIVKSIKNRIKAKIEIESFPENEATVDAFLADVKKAWKQALKKTQKTAAKPVKPANPAIATSPLMGKTLDLEGQTNRPEKEEGVDEGENKANATPSPQSSPARGEETQQASASIPIVTPESDLAEFIKQANQQKIDILGAFKEKIKTPEGRAQIESAAKANGFQTPEEFIAKMEKDLRDQGLL